MNRRLLLALAVVLGISTPVLAIDVNPPLQVRWTATPSRTIEGRVYNEFHTPITNIRLLVEAFDESNRLVGTKYGYVFGDLGPGESRYFGVWRVPPAAYYRVVVESYVQQQFPGGGGSGPSSR